MREISPEFFFIGELKESLKLCLDLIYKEGSGPLQWAEVENVLHLYEYGAPKEVFSFPVAMTAEMLFPVVCNWLKTKEPKNPRYDGDGSNVIGFQIQVEQNHSVSIKPYNIFYGK